MSGLAPGAATMTVLFTDLVGSTAMRARLGDDRADALQREHDELLTRVISDQRGTVVKGLGDGLMAVFHAPSEALAAAVGINKALARRNRKASEPLVLRMGMSIGEVRVEGDDVFGTPVVEASRLCGAADDDQILVSEHVRALVGTRTPVALERVGELELKGLAEPLGSWQATWWAATDAVAVPLPELVLAASRSRFVGRKLERFALADAWSRARAGRGPVVVVSGPDASGKSRLATAFAQAHHDEGALVLAGRCDPVDTEPFAPFLEALRFHVGHLSDAQLPEQLGPGAATLTQLLPELRERLGGSASSDLAATVQQLRLFDAVVAWLEASAKGQPLVVLLDDLHAATPSTLALVDHIARSPANLRLLVIATWRTVDGVHDPALDRFLDGLRASHRGAEHIHLGPVDVATVDELISDRLGAPADQRAGRLTALLAPSGGCLPGHCLDVVDDLVRSGMVVARSGHWSFAGDPDLVVVPAGPTACWAERLDRLEPAARRAVQVAALVGEAFDTRLVRAVLDRVDGGCTDAGLADLLDAAVRAGVIDPPAANGMQQRFSHPLAASLARETLDAPSRRAVHLAVADEIDRDVGPNRGRAVFALAHHVVAASAEPVPPDLDPRPDLARAVELAAVAADGARSVQAYAEALTWYRHALACHSRIVPAADARWIELCIEAGVAAHAARTGDAAAIVRQAVTVAAASGQQRLLLDAVLAACSVSIDRPPPSDPLRFAALRWAVDASSEVVGETRVRSLAHLAVEAIGTEEAARRFAWADEAMSSSRSIGSPVLRSEVLTAALVANDTPGRLDVRRRLCDELVEVAEVLDDPTVRFRAAVHEAGIALEAAARDRFDAAVAQARLTGSYLRDASCWHQVLALEAQQAYLDGALDRAVGLAADAARFRPGDPDARAFAVDVALAAARWQGTLGEDHRLDDELAGATGARRLRLACLAAEVGRVDPARTVYAESSLAGVERDGPDAGVIAVSLGTLAALLADAAGCQVLRQRLAPEVDHCFASAEPLPVAAHTAAMLAAASGEPAEAQRLHAQAVGLHEGLRAPLLAAESRLEWARLSHILGEVEQARVLVEQARAAARTHGAPGLEAQARALLAVIETPGRRLGETAS